MNAYNNNETGNILKQLGNKCMKTLSTENEFEFENCQRKIENPDDT